MVVASYVQKFLQSARTVFLYSCSYYSSLRTADVVSGLAVRSVLL